MGRFSTTKDFPLRARRLCVRFEFLKNDLTQRRGARGARTEENNIQRQADFELDLALHRRLLQNDEKEHGLVRVFICRRSICEATIDGASFDNNSLPSTSPAPLREIRISEE